MWRRLVCWFGCLLLLTCCFLPLGQAQPPLQPLSNQAEPEEGRSPPALQYAVAAIATIIVMVVLLAPTRKSVR